MNRSFNINFNGVDMPSFLKVKAVNTSLFPEISHNFKEVAGSKGVKEAGTSFGAKEIKVDFIIVVPKDKNLMQMERELSYWLMGNSFKTSPLIISDEPDLMYMAKVKDAVEVKDALFTGDGTITFVVPSGMASNRFEKHGAVAGKEINIYYNGTAETYPVIEFTPTQDYMNQVLKVVEVKTGNAVILQGTFKANEKVIIDCSKRLVKVGGKLALSMISLESDWIKIEGRGLHKITLNLDGKIDCIYKENWF